MFLRHCCSGVSSKAMFYKDILSWELAKSRIWVSALVGPFGKFSTYSLIIFFRFHSLQKRYREFLLLITALMSFHLRPVSKFYKVHWPVKLTFNKTNLVYVGGSHFCCKSTQRSGALTAPDHLIGALRLWAARRSQLKGGRSPGVTLVTRDT